MAPANVDPIDEETNEPTEANDPGLAQAQKDKAKFKSGLTAVVREAHDRLTAELESLEAWADNHPEEIRACALLMDVLGIRGHREDGKPVYERVDVGPEDSLNDFDLHLPDGRRFAVEVTRDISPVARQYEKMVENEDVHPEGFPKTSAVLDHHWRIDIEPSPSSHPLTAVQELQDNIELLLKRAEELGVDDPCFPESTFPDLTRETKAEIDKKISLRERLRGLGVRHANHADTWTDHDGTGKLITARLSGPIGWFGSDSINGPVERHLKPNLKKLQPAIEDPIAEAHLFIWVYPGDPRAGALSAMQTSDISKVEPPDLHGVDTVWLAIDSTWVPADLIRSVADKTDKTGTGMPRLPGLPICRLTDGGWERYTCGWHPGAEKTQHYDI